MDLSMNYMNKAFTSKNIFLEKINRPNAASLQDNRGLGVRAWTGWRFSCEEWEARDKWDQPAVVWSLPCDGRTPPPPSSLTPFLQLSQSPKSFSPLSRRRPPLGTLHFLSPMKWCVQHNSTPRPPMPPSYTTTYSLLSPKLGNYFKNISCPGFCKAPKSQ